jgi:hypothetical protein
MGRVRVLVLDAGTDQQLEELDEGEYVVNTHFVEAVDDDGDASYWSIVVATDPDYEFDAAVDEADELLNDAGVIVEE